MKIVKLFAYYGTILVLVIEIGLRIYDPWGFKYFAEAAKYKHYFIISDSLTFYRHRINTRAKFMGVDMQTDDIGAVSKPDTKPPDLMVLGDSMVLSWGVPYDSSYMALIGADLAFGVGSWNTRNEVDWFVRSKVIPKTLVWMIVPNDVVPKTSFEPCWEPKCFFYRNSLLIAIKQYLRKDLHEHDKNVYQTEWQYAVSEMAEFCRLHKIRLMPFFYWYNDNLAFVAYRHLLSEKGYVLKRFPDSIYPNCFSKMDKHPNIKGHRMIANYLKSIL